jgi:hypothetical protein
MSTSLPPHLKTRLLDAMSKAPSPARAEVRARALRAWGLGGALSALVFAAVGISIGTRPVAFILATAFGWALVAAAATFGAYGRGRSMLGRSRPLLVLVVALTAPSLLAWLFACLSVWPGAGVDPGNPLIHLACFTATMGLSIGPLFAMFYVRRGADPVHPRVQAAALGAAAGALGGVLIDVHCAVAHPTHVLLAHVLPALVLAALGAVFGVRALGVRRDS